MDVLPPHPIESYQDTPGPTIEFDSEFAGPAQRLNGANVIITGGASGIGKACAKAFLEHGCYVTIADLDTPVLKATSEEFSGEKFQAVACDVTDWSAQIRLFESAVKLSPRGVVDVVLPCAGPRGGQFSFDAPDLSVVVNGVDGLKEKLPPPPPPPRTMCIQVALVGMVYTCQLAVWYMAHRKESLRCLVIVGSMTAYRGIGGSLDYIGAKFGARGLFKALRDSPANLEGAEDGPALRVNMLCPGYIRTPLIEASLDGVLQTGVRLSHIEALVGGVLRMAADQTIHGKAIGVSPDGCFDIRDDIPGLNGMTAVNEQMWFERQDNINRRRVGIW